MPRCCECLGPLRTWPGTRFTAPKLGGLRVLQGGREQLRLLVSAAKQSQEVSVLQKNEPARAPSPALVPRILRNSGPGLFLGEAASVTSGGSLVFQLAAFCGFLVLQSFSVHDQAWAFTGDVISPVQQGAAFFGDLDEIKNGFTLAFLLIFFSELGDKTFFIAAILATRKSNFAVFTGTFGALVAMTLISVTLGRAFHYIDGVLPFSLGNTEIPVDDLAAVVLLIYFGVSTLVDAASMEGSKADEEQQEAELAVAGVNGGTNTMSNVVVATFALVFVAEWGDKSFFSTIALAAASSPVGVVAGAVAGHGAATLIAVLGGSILGNYISEKVIAYIGGTLFLVFAAETLFEIFSGTK